MRFCPKCGAYWEDIEESCKRCGALLSASGHVDSSPRLNRTFVRILALLCMACGLVAAYLGFMTGVMVAGLAAMMRDPSLGFLIILFPVAVILPFFIVSFFLFRARSWGRRAFVVLLTLWLVPLAAVFGEEVGLHPGFPSLDFGAPFMFFAAVLILTITPRARKAFGRLAGLWWLEAGLAALPVLFSMRMSEARSIRQEVEIGGQQAERNAAEFLELLQRPESSETDEKIDQLIRAGVYSSVRRNRDMPPLAVLAKNHPRAVKALLDAGALSSAAYQDPTVWKDVAESGRFDLLPDVARHGIRTDPKVAEQFGVELIRMIREDRNETGYRERVTGLIQGGADLTVIDQGRTALEEAMRSGQTEIEDRLREQMKLPARSQLSERRDEVEVPPRIYEFRESSVIPCPIVRLNAEFTLNRRETVHYRFTDELTNGPPDTLQFNAEVGRNTVGLRRVVGIPGRKVSGWIQFELIAGKLHLTTAQKQFAVDCR